MNFENIMFSERNQMPKGQILYNFIYLKISRTGISREIEPRLEG